MNPLSSSTAVTDNARTMKAARIDRFGPPDIITVTDIAIPEPAKGDVLVRIVAAGVGPWDGWIRSGKSAMPLTLGSDLAGIVEAVGPDVGTFAAGDAVFGVTNPQFVGSNAEYAIAAAGMIARKPSSIGNVEAASVPVIAVTAWQALFDKARLQRGQRVLVHGAAGNVGAYAVQFACKAGLDVFATASSRDIDRVRALGAHAAIDHRRQRFEDVVHGVDAVIDLVGGETQARSFAVLKTGGILVSAVSEPDKELAARHGVEAGFFLVDVTTECLERIASMIDGGELRTNVGLVLPLADVRQAHEALEGARPNPHGKIVLRVAA